MARAWIPLAVVLGLALVVGAFALVLFVVRALWAWTIPDLFPGAVAQGLVAGSIGWLTAFKVVLLGAVLGALAGVRRGRDLLGTTCEPEADS